MIKSTYVKLMLTFITIIGVSFIMLSVVFTVMIQDYTSEESDGRLKQAGTFFADYYSSRANEGNLAYYVKSVSPDPNMVKIVTSMNDLDLIFVNSENKILKSTVGKDKEYEGKTLSMDKFISTDDGEFLMHWGTLFDELPGKYQVFARKITDCDHPEKTIGYVLTLKSTVAEEKIIGVTRRAVITASLWVMVAAMIATYFVSERILAPMREMTAAAKKFGKGEFSTRVEVSGNDEVADLANAFNAMAESLENYDKMRNSFLASVSHDLRTPMTTIAGFIDGINSGAIPPENQAHYLEIISTEVHRLSRLVGQLLDVSRLASGERKFSMENFDIAEVSRLILISFEKQIDGKKLDVEFESEDCVPVFADKDAIYQVLYNLCHNAIKFSKEGGKFAIRIASEGKNVKVSVYNEGNGIPKEDLPFIFDRFYKSDKSRGMDKTGFGLGLYICKTIVDAHDGSLTVRSEEGKDCEFTMTVKAGENKKKQSPSAEK